jgi:hypothetical protein
MVVTTVFSTFVVERNQCLRILRETRMGLILVQIEMQVQNSFCTGKKSYRIPKLITQSYRQFVAYTTG